MIYELFKLKGTLLYYSSDWGKSKGAELSFLATDRENIHSINLYKKLGYIPNPGHGQINMSRKF